jgi:dihydrofolate reductase
MNYLKAIAAMSENRVIGQGNRIPWHLPEDFRWFKQTTMGHVLLMGRKTFESIGRPLPGRETWVLSRSGWKYPGVRVLTRLEEVQLEEQGREIFVCGGAEIYRQTLGFCRDLYLTRVRRVVEGDAFFPEFEPDFEWVADLMETEDFVISHYQNRNPRTPGG